MVRPVVRAAADWLEAFLIDEAGTDADLVLSGFEIVESLSEIADRADARDRSPVRQGDVSRDLALTTGPPEPLQART